MAGGPELLLLQIALILLAGKVGAEIFTRLKQPVVAGEILIGVILGPSLLGLIPSFDVLHSVEAFFAGTGAAVTAAEFQSAQGLLVLGFLAELGVLLLLFEVGLESSFAEFKRVGASALLVGTYGVLFSLVAGAGVSYLLAQEIDWVITPNAVAQPHLLHLFIGATLTATSIGITARVLGELKKIRTPEAQIILGAAVFDDVLGLIVLAIVSGLVVSPESLTAFGVTRVFVVSLGFFFVAILLGRRLAPPLIAWVHDNFRSEYVHVGFGFIFMILVSFLATAVGLASIVGAFAAGLALSGSAHRHILFEHIKPVGSLFIGFFFVVLGARVDLRQVTGDAALLVLAVAVALCVVGVLAKLAAGWGVIRVKASRYVVGVGMVPRGEVGLIFALYGLDALLVTNWQYTAILLVVLVTTLVTPFWLKAIEAKFSPAAEEAPPPSVRVGEAIQP